MTEPPSAARRSSWVLAAPAVVLLIAALAVGVCSDDGERQGAHGGRPAARGTVRASRATSDAPRSITAEPSRPPEPPPSMRRVIDVRDLATGDALGGFGLSVANFSGSGTVDVVTGSDGVLPVEVPADREPTTGDFLIPSPYRPAGLVASGASGCWSLWLFREVKIHVNVIAPPEFSRSSVHVSAVSVQPGSGVLPGSRTAPWEEKWIRDHVHPGGNPREQVNGSGTCEITAAAVRGLRVLVRSSDRRVRTLAVPVDVPPGVAECFVDVILRPAEMVRGRLVGADVGAGRPVDAVTTVTRIMPLSEIEFDLVDALGDGMTTLGTDTERMSVCRGLNAQVAADGRFEVPLPEFEGAMTVTLIRSPDVYVEVALEAGVGRDVGDVVVPLPRRVRLMLDDRPLSRASVNLVHESTRAGQKLMGSFVTDDDGFATIPGLVQNGRYIALSGGPPLHVGGRVNVSTWDGSDVLRWMSR